jgi:hypothetical protein
VAVRKHLALLNHVGKMVGCLGIAPSSRRLIAEGKIFKLPLALSSNRF